MISEITRKEIIDILDEGYRTDEFVYYGSLDELKFFNRLYKLAELPSTDSRFSHADRDIHKHLFANNDWDWDWFYHYYNDNFDLVANDQKFLDFLAESFHPTVRGKIDSKTKEYLEKINYLLRFDGYQIVPTKSISGRAIYGWKETQIDQVLLKNIESLKENFNSAYIDNQIDIIVSMADEHPNLAIGKSKELIESCAKTILKDQKIDFNTNMELGPLVKKTYQFLSIHSSSLDKENKHYQTALKLLSNLSGITQYMAELRNAYGNGHGKDSSFQNLPPRYAHLAIGAATTVVRFMWDTYNEIKEVNKTF